MFCKIKFIYLGKIIIIRKIKKDRDITDIIVRLKDSYFLYVWETRDKDSVRKHVV